MDIIPFLAIIGFAFANIGATVTLFILSKNHASTALEKNRKETNRLIEAIHQEMRDFHGRLCAIEERNKK